MSDNNLYVFVVAFERLNSEHMFYDGKHFKFILIIINCLIQCHIKTLEID